MMNPLSWHDAYPDHPDRDHRVTRQEPDDAVEWAYHPDYCKVHDAFDCGCRQREAEKDAD